MDIATPLIVLMIACWATLFLCVALGAAAYHFPDLVGVNPRRGFDVLPARDHV